MTAANATTRKGPKVPSYRLHKPSGLAVVRLNGQDVYLGAHGSPESEDAYRRTIAEWCAHGAIGRQRHSSIAINELLLRYWRHVEVDYTKNGEPTSEQSIIRMSLRPVRRMYGQNAVEEFTPLELKTVRQDWIDRSLARTTINKYCSRIIACFRWGVEECVVPSSVLEGLRAVRGLRRGRPNARETAPARPVDSETLELTQPLLPPVVWDMLRTQEHNTSLTPN
jgi:hypothetical protein